MGRRAKLERPLDVHLKLPTSLIGEIGLLLWSDVHGRVPLGKLSEFFELCAREKLARIRAELQQHNEEKDDATATGVRGDGSTAGASAG